MSKELTDAELIQQFEKLNNEELQELLSQEESVHNRVIIRKVIRTRSQTPVAAASSHPVPVINCNNINGGDLDKLNEQLRNETDFEKRREIRKKIRDITNSNIIISSPVKEPSIQLQRSTTTHVSRNTISSDLKKPSDEINKPLFNVVNKPRELESKQTICLQPKRVISVHKSDNLELKVTHPLLKSKNPCTTWYYKERKIKECPSYQFRNLKHISSDNATAISFSLADRTNHAGVYKVHIEDGHTTYTAEFELSVLDNPPIEQSKAEDSLSKLSSNSTIHKTNASRPDSSSTKVVSPTISGNSLQNKKPFNTTFTQLSPTKNEETTKKEENHLNQPNYTNAVKIESNNIQNIDRPTNQDKISNQSKINNSTVNSTFGSYVPTKPVSRVTSIKQLFDNPNNQDAAKPTYSKSTSFNPPAISITKNSESHDNQQNRPVSNNIRSTDNNYSNNLTAPAAGNVRKTSQTNYLDINSSQLSSPNHSPRDSPVSYNNSQRKSSVDNYRCNGLLSLPQNTPKSRSRSGSIMKDFILLWITKNTEEYENINITNYTTSWADGLAFCALIHHFYPQAFNYDQLLASNAIQNFQLAFDTAKNYGKIEPLLEPEDMTSLSIPDDKCVYTYLQHMYQTLKDHPKNVLLEAMKNNK